MDIFWQMVRMSLASMVLPLVPLGSSRLEQIKDVSTGEGEEVCREVQRTRCDWVSERLDLGRKGCEPFTVIPNTRSKEEVQEKNTRICLGASGGGHGVLENQ